MGGVSYFQHGISHSEGGNVEIQFGIETEYGISRQQDQPIDVVAESIALVRSAVSPGVRMCWDYSKEDPHLDMRGFRVQELRQDTDERYHTADDSRRQLSFREIKSDLVLSNGARFYNDHAHPEYCTPECTTPLEILQQEVVGERILMGCASALHEKTGVPVLLYKNNTDFFGHSYGCHENYLMPRTLPWAKLAENVLAFLVTRQIYAGAGKYGWEEEDRFLQGGFQISQRSDFFSVLQSVDTMQRRPLINTRDEPHADAGRFRRFHVILGDSNLSPFAAYLKIGVTALVLQALCRAGPDAPVPHLENPLEAVKAISRDPSFRWEVAGDNGRRTNAVEVQRRYLDLVRRYGFEEDGEEWRRVVDVWEETLDDLESEPLGTADRLDWSAKYRLIEDFRARENIAGDDPWVRSLDLAYHRLDPEEGLFLNLFQEGAFRLPYSAPEIFDKGLEPPASTRAAVRGLCVRKFGPRIYETQWEHLGFQGESGERFILDLRDLFSPGDIAKAVRFIANSERVEDLRALPFAKERNRG